MDQEYAVDFNLLCSVKGLYMQMIIGTVFEKGKKRPCFIVQRHVNMHIYEYKVIWEEYDIWSEKLWSFRYQ